jgi:anti-sigma regulatory factor (Ser/Thr protein kinase)
MADAELVVELSGGFNLRQIERLLVRLDPLLHLEDPTVVKLDLSRLVFMTPSAMALFTAASKRVLDLGLVLQESTLKPPNSPPVRNYLMRMNVFRELTAISDSIERHEAVGFRPCEHFMGERDYPRVARGLTDALCERCQTDNVARAAIRVAMDEISENVIHHADTSLGGFAAAQGWRKRSEFEVAIVDLGVGIKASLSTNPDYTHITSDVEAIETAVQPYVTATPERNGGIGLFVTNLLLAANGGEMLIRSGNGAMHSGDVISTHLRTVDLPGTMVVLRANTDRPLDINAVYQQLPERQDANPHASHHDHAAHTR